MVGKDLIMATLFGSGGGSSGSGGGGSGGVSTKEVNFYDYDGTCVHAYTVAEAQALSELPAGPEHPGLVFQGWNWSLEGVKGLTRAMNIGAMYTTDDGTTRLYITLQEGRTSMRVHVDLDVGSSLTVDWGDGSEPDVISGVTGTNDVTPEHKYNESGNYTIKLTVDGTMRVVGSSVSKILESASSSGTDNRKVYLNSLQRVEIGDNVKSFDMDAFAYCHSLESISIPRSVTAIESQAFSNCTALVCVHIPAGIKAVNGNNFNTCTACRTITLPEGLENINSAACQNAKSIGSITIPDSVTTIASSAFFGCHCMARVIMPANVSSVEANTFSYCYGVAIYDFTACTAVPALSATSAFNNIPADCEIRVPAALYDEWIAATNWATYADKIKAY